METLYLLACAWENKLNIRQIAGKIIFFILKILSKGNQLAVNMWLSY